MRRKKIERLLTIFCLLLFSCKHDIQDETTKNNGTHLEGEFCNEKEGCAVPLICRDNICKHVCTNDTDCDPDQRCENSVCIKSESQQCANDNNCIAPTACENSENARCIAGKCVYVKKKAGDSCDDKNYCTENDQCNSEGQCSGTTVECKTPPKSYCLDDDNTWRQYNQNGTCDPASGCKYTYNDAACENCSLNCQGFCEDVVCPDSTGACQGLMCDPLSTAKPPCTIQYKAISTPCDLEENSGLLDGYCENNKCYECTEDSQCTNMPTWHECFIPQCYNHKCIYLPKEPPATCGDRCFDGNRYDNGDCSSDGSSCSAIPTFCKGFKCDEAGMDCLTLCRNSDDCIEGYFCNAKNICQDKDSPGALPAGYPCDEDDECLSGLCIDVLHHKECTALCSSDDDCYNNLVCGKLNPRDSNSLSVCQPRTQKACSPCSTDNDCQKLGTLCQEMDGGNFCLGPCSDDNSCPTGFVCKTTSADGVESKQCWPETDSCLCNMDNDGATRQCFNNNEGVGICFGLEHCNGQEARWEGCDAQVPIPEICDNIDNDCDGSTDTNPNGTLLTQECGYGYNNITQYPTHCASLSYCNKGTYGKCTIPVNGLPLADIPCNNVDDNCNGQIDESTCPSSADVYQWGCQNLKCTMLKCKWPYFDVDNNASNGCEVKDDYYYTGGKYYHNYTAAMARPVTTSNVIDSSGKSSIAYCNGLLPKDSRVNYYSASIPDISYVDNAYVEGTDYFYFQYTDGLLAVINLKLKVLFDNTGINESGNVRVCLSSKLDSKNSTPSFSYCQNLTVGKNQKGTIVFDHNNDKNYFTAAGWYYIYVKNVSAFKGKYHLQLIEDAADNDITGTTPACK